MATRKTEDRLDRVERILESLAASVVARDDQIEAHTRQIGALIDLATKHEKALEKSRKLHDELNRQFQAYLSTIHRRQ